MIAADAVSAGDAERDGARGGMSEELRWLRRFFKPINIKKEKSESKAEISSFLLVCVPLGLTKQMKEKKNVKTRTFNTGSYGRSAI